MEEKHKAVLPPNYKKMLAVQIKKLVLADKLTKVKASFKLAEGVKKVPAKKPVKKTL
jgi:histone H1/5